MKTRGRPNRGLTPQPTLTRYRKRAQAMVIYLGGRCAYCGMSNQAHQERYGTDLELDHIDRSTKEFNPKAHWVYSWEHLQPELDKCQPLCRPCHQHKTSQEA